MPPRKNPTTVTSPRKPRQVRKVYNEVHIWVGIILIAILQTGFVISVLMTYTSLELPNINNVASYRPAEATVIYDRYGNVIDRMFIENRQVVTLDEMPDLLPKAFIAAEDGRFYEHPGLDLFSVFRAAINNVIAGRKGQGGSTITQQVAKSLLLTPEKTYIRKIREAILSWRIDSVLSKDEIVYIYLNQIYLGEGAFGVEAAAQTYFGKPVHKLSLGEIALLAGLPQAPSKYSPMRHLKRAMARQKYVLNRLAADGYISEKQAMKAYDEKIKIRKNNLPGKASYGYYLDHAKAEAREILGGNLQKAGAKIYTNLDPKLQSKATKIISQGTAGFEARKNVLSGKSKERTQAALVCIENKSGKVLALTGGTNYVKSPFNRATQAKRPVGSTFKPILYATALKENYNPDSIISDAKFSMRGKDGKTWSPKNYSGRYHGDVTLIKALTHSYNAASLRLMQKIGYRSVQNTARLSGIDSPLQNDLSLSLGAVDLSLLEITGAYQPFANQGVYKSPQFISKITLVNGAKISLPRQNVNRVYTKTVTQNMRRMLNSVIINGSGRKASYVTNVIGGKTGTTNDNRDAWFIGFSNKYTTGVWFGNDHNEVLGKKITGGSLAAPVWANFMDKL
ncbi:MAG: PBP1A family penicillin-binding protein [Desulfotalea sp.]